MTTRGAYDFPVYTRAERIADAAVHVTGVPLAAAGAVWLMSASAGRLTDAAKLSLLAYLLALVGTLLVSAAYNLVRAGRLKENLRRLDHAMIYAMIAGTYTPFAGHYLQRGGSGLWLEMVSLAVVWAVALAGGILKLAFPRRLEMAGFALYLGLGWAMVLLGWPMWAALPLPSLALLGVGGVIYTLGAAVHLRETVPYHNAVWHALVLAAAGCHFAAIALQA
jgi:hemolysin III